MALDQGGIFRCELLHVSQCLDAEAARAESMHRPACMPIGSDGGKNGLLFEMKAGADISHDAIIVSAVG
jgi:hypothetical protein